MFVRFLCLCERKKKRPLSPGSLAFALWCSDGLRRKRSALKQNYTHFTRVTKNKDSAFFSISDKSVPYFTLTSLPGVSWAGLEDVPHQHPSSPCTTQWPKDWATARGSPPPRALTPPLEVNPQRPQTAILCVCVCFRHKRLSLPFNTKWSTWLRCDIIALWEGWP